MNEEYILKYVANRHKLIDFLAYEKVLLLADIYASLDMEKSVVFRKMSIKRN